MALGTGANKANSRRSSRHKDYYSSFSPKFDLHSLKKSVN